MGDNIINTLTTNVCLLTNIQYNNYYTMYQEIVKLKQENDTLKAKVSEKRKLDSDEENEQKTKKPKTENKYKLINYKTNKHSYDDDTIKQIFSNIKSIHDIISLKTKWVNIKHNIKLQCLHNLIPALEKLDKMIGLTNIKDEIFKIIIYYIQNDHIDEYLHTVIEGPPGVGKTEFARIYADIFVRLGILKNDTFIQIKRDDLIAKYLGQTSHRTKDLLNSGMGGVIFLDEAYSIGDYEKRDSFSKEAIDMINQYLSEKKGEFMFIIAGYEDDLERCFFNFNKGLKRRFSHRFKIEKYTENELIDIFKLKAASLNYIIDIKDEVLYNFFKKNYSKFEYYGGDIERLINYIKYEQSIRCFKQNLDDNYDIVIADLENSIKNFDKKEKDSPPFGMYT